MLLFCGCLINILKLINYSCADDPISLHQLGQVHVFWYPMNIPIKLDSISSKTDQETWILISLNTKYSISAASTATSEQDKPSKNNTPNSIPKTVHFKILNKAV